MRTKVLLAAATAALVRASLVPQGLQTVFQLSSHKPSLDPIEQWRPASLQNLAEHDEAVVRISGLDDAGATARQLEVKCDYWKVRNQLTAKQDLGLDVWQVRKDFLDVRVASDYDLATYGNTTQLIPSLKELFAISRMHHEASIRDFTLSTMQSPDTGLHAIYHPYSAIESMLKLFASDYPEFARLEDIGKSAEGRSIYALTISDYKQRRMGMTWRSRRQTSSKKEHEPVKEKKKLGFALIGGVHAREWIAPASLLYLAHSLLSAAALPPTDEADESLAVALSDYEFQFIPVVNPDGYVYTWEHDRLWQKNRQYTMSDDPRCHGIDLNRNWEYKFEKPQRPAPCSDLYPGSEAFEAVELQVVSQYLQRVKESSGLHVFADAHSFGQMLMYPYSYTCSIVPPDAENLFEGLLSARKAIKNVHKQSYDVGSVCDVSYTATGQSLDWVYHALGAKWSFTFNLRDQGVYAFLLPPEQIIESGQELLAGVLDLAEFIAKREKIED